jgi:CRP-like cAMP-binding protein
MASPPRPSPDEVRAFSFLAPLPEVDLDRLVAGSRRLRVQPGATLITEGESDDRLFLIVSGELSVHTGGSRIASAGAGDPVGEIAATPTGHSFRRTATVRAETAAEVIEVPAELIQSLAADHPALRSYFASLRARRLSFDAITRHVER